MKIPLVHITSSVLRWGRTSAGYSVDEVVEKINQKTVTAETVQNWENGDDLPSYTQLEKLSKIYHRPLAIFFAPKPPEEQQSKHKLRSLPPQDADKIPPGIRFIIRDAQVRQMDLAELHDGRLPAQTFNWLKEIISSPVTSERIPQIAQEIRKRLDIPLPTQKGWKDNYEALNQWREAIENLGLWVFKEPFGKKEEEEKYDGFYLPDEKFPVIYLNSSRRTPERQIFTLFHELGHVLLSKGGICFRHDIEREWRGRFQQEEVFCNKFAGDFLVPNEDLHLHLPEKLDDDMAILNYIKNCAKMYRVSQELILRKLKNQDLLTWNDYNRTVEQWKQQYRKPKDTKSSGPDFYTKQRASLGNKFLELTFSQYYRRHISKYQLADYLGVKLNSLPGLESTIYKK